MVGIVVVSHSHALAQAAVTLARQMPPGDTRTGEVRIAVAAGLDETTLGTDATRIAEAITSADQGAGVVVLMDLGSAVLAAEFALDLLGDEVRGRVILCPAPLVEGLIVAAVTAAGGATREEVAAEAAAALAGKQSQLGSPPPVPSGGGTGHREADRGGRELTARFTVDNPHGLHARPAARLVQAVRGLDAQVRLRNLTTGSAWAPGSSLSKVATLGALEGHTVEVRVAGNQAREALDQVLALAEGGFDDPAHPAAATAPSPAAPEAAPSPAAPGVVVGPARPVRSGPLDVPEEPGTDPGQEWRRLQEVLATVRRDVHRVRARVARAVGEADAALFDAHLLLLDDTELLDEVRGRVDGGQAAAPAWAAVVSRVAAEFAALPGRYLRARAADLRAVGDQVLRGLLGVPQPDAGPPGVLVAADLSPAEVAELDRTRVAAVLLAFGSTAAHSTILLRARGIPAVVGAGPGVLDIADGTPLAIDGAAGEFVVDPPAELVAAWQARAAERARRERRDLAQATAPARTRDGVAVLVGANVGSVEDARVAAAGGADLAGLVRTEFLFLDRGRPPEVEEQEAVYREIAAALDGRRITLRTLDAGADKRLGYLPADPAANPALGVRGIRLSLAQPRLFADQLLAMVRVARDVPVSVLFPMITSVRELRRARELLDQAVTRAGRGTPPGLRVGIMVEVPATALRAAVFAGHVDFLSIGTNDLTQYALAAERGNPAVAEIGDPFDPGVLRLVAATCRDAGPRARVAVCGELAADERAGALLVGLGIRELSVTSPAVPGTKRRVRGLDTREAAALAAAALDAHGPEAVRELLTTRPMR